MINLDELINRRPDRWGNLTIKEFERDIKILQDACRMYESVIVGDEATKNRLLEKIELYEKVLNGIIELGKIGNNYISLEAQLAIKALEE